MTSMFVSLDDVGVKTFSDTSTGGGKDDWKNIKADPIKGGSTAAFRFMEETDSSLFLKKVPLHTFLAAVGSIYCINDAEHRAKGEHCPWCQEVATGLNDKMEQLVKISGVNPSDFKSRRMFTEDCQKQIGLGQQTFFKMKSATVENDAKILNVAPEKIPLLKVLVEIKELENLQAKAFSFVPVFDHRVRDFRILEITNGLMNILSNNFVSLGQKLTDSDIIVKKNKQGPNWWGATKQSAEPLHADVMKKYSETKGKFTEYYKRVLTVKDNSAVQTAYQKYLTKKNEGAAGTGVKNNTVGTSNAKPAQPVDNLPKQGQAAKPTAIAVEEPSDDEWNF